MSFVASTKEVAKNEKKFEIFENIIRKEKVIKKILETRKFLRIPVKGLNYDKYYFSEKVHKLSKEKGHYIIDCRIWIIQKYNLSKDFGDLIDDYILFGIKKA